MSRDLKSPPTELPPEERSPDERSPGELSSRRRWLALAVLCVTVLIVNLDNTVLNVALPTLVRDLNATSSDLPWMVDAYILVFAGLLLAAGSLANRVGREDVAGRPGDSPGLGLGGHFSRDVHTLIAARASVGVGGTLMIPSTLSIISDMFRDRAERQRAIALWAVPSASAWPSARSSAACC